ncbi:unnamed protein product, partial [Phaeothamnion confervicola]
QATHNEAALAEGRFAYQNQKYTDARLTTIGKEQCAKLRPEAAALASDIELVVVSPLTRAIETAQLGLKTPSHVPWVALDCIRERAGHHPCDKRRTRAELLGDFPAIDFSQIPPGADAYWDSFGTDRETDEAI